MAGFIDFSLVVRVVVFLSLFALVKAFEMLSRSFEVSFKLSLHVDTLETVFPLAIHRSGTHGHSIVSGDELLHAAYASCFVLVWLETGGELRVLGDELIAIREKVVLRPAHGRLYFMVEAG